jgi:formylglycine-generating enzyme required for sulfatase activity
MKKNIPLIFVLALLFQTAISFAQILDPILGPRVTLKNTTRYEAVITVPKRNIQEAFVSNYQSFGIYSYDGKELLSPEYVELNRYYNNLARVKHSNGLYGFINRKGYPRIETKYQYASDFKEGHSWAKLEGKFGVIDTLGRTVVPFKYDSISDCGKDKFVAHFDDYVAICSFDENVLWKNRCNEMRVFVNGYARYASEGYWSVRKDAGKHYNFSSADYISDMSTNRFAIMRDGKWAYMNQYGEVKTNFVYDAAFSFEGMWAWAIRDQYYVLIDSNYNEFLWLKNEKGVNRVLDSMFVYQQGGVDLLTSFLKRNNVWIIEGQVNILSPAHFIKEWKQYGKVRYTSPKRTIEHKSFDSLSVQIHFEYLKKNGRCYAKLRVINAKTDIGHYLFDDLEVYEDGEKYSLRSKTLRNNIKCKDINKESFELSHKVNNLLTGEYFFIGHIGGRKALFNKRGDQISKFNLDEIRPFGNKAFMIIFKDMPISHKANFGNIPSKRMMKNISEFKYIEGGLYTPENLLNGQRTERDTALCIPYAAPKRQYVEPFFMYETEITNSMYRMFVHYVRDSIVHMMLGEAGNPKELGEHYKGERVWYTDDSIKYKYRYYHRINWDQEIEWENEEVQYILDDPNYGIYMPENERFYHAKRIDTRKLWYYYKDGNEWVDLPIYPDTLVWTNDFPYSFCEPMSQNYFWHPAYDHYPVVGISYEQAKAFCHWYNKMIVNYYGSDWTNVFGEIRLPTAQEMEYASIAKGRWGAMYDDEFFLERANIGVVRDDNNLELNNYTSDGGFFTIINSHYSSNYYGLYDLQGNVSEFVSSHNYNVLAYDIEHVFNQSFQSYCNSQPRDQIMGLNQLKNLSYSYMLAKPTYHSHGYVLRNGAYHQVIKPHYRAMVKGGSWANSTIYAHPSAAQLLNPKAKHSSVGFRMVFSVLPTTSLTGFENKQVIEEGKKVYQHHKDLRKEDRKTLWRHRLGRLF